MLVLDVLKYMNLKLHKPSPHICIIQYENGTTILVLANLSLLFHTLSLDLSMVVQVYNPLCCFVFISHY